MRTAVHTQVGRPHALNRRCCLNAVKCFIRSLVLYEDAVVARLDIFAEYSLQSALL